MTRPEPRILLTGFDAFGGAALNPSWLVARALDRSRIAGWRVVALQLPTVFAGSAARVQAALALHKPRLVLCLGQAGGRAEIGFERVAINLDDARIADNAGAQPIDRPAAADGPAAYFSTLPVKAMRDRVLAAGLPAAVSHTAGTFVCNHVFYALMQALSRQPAGANPVRGGFAHLPWLPEQGAPSLALEQQVDAIRMALEAAVLQREGDVAGGAGTLD